MLVSHGSGHGKKITGKPVNNMDKSSFDAIGGIIAIVMGLFFAFFHRPLAHKTANFYSRLSHVQLGEKGYNIGFLVFGIAFVIFGLLTVLHWKFK